MEKLLILLLLIPNLVMAESSCVEGDCLNGQGTRIYSNGDKYVGQWKEGSRHGQGTFFFSNGSKYVGQWKDNGANGKGTFFFGTGRKLIGQWKDGKCHSSCTSSKKAKVQNPKVQNRGYELACDGYPPQNSPHKLISIDCSNREIFIGTLRDSWLSLRRQGIGGTLENLCWEAYNDAKDLHPSIGFLSVSGSFLMRCNMGLAYAKD